MSRSCGWPGEEDRAGEFQLGQTLAYLVEQHQPLRDMAMPHTTHKPFLVIGILNLSSGLSVRMLKTNHR
jgi:hypothetical protein